MSKSTAKIVSRAKHTLSGIKDAHIREQVGAVVEDLGEAIISQSRLLEKSQAAIEKAAREIQLQKSARRRDAFQVRLEKMFNAGNPNVQSKEKIAKHLKMVMSMEDAAAENYLNLLEDVPANPKGRHVSKSELIEPEGVSDNRIERAKHQLREDRGLRSAGVKAEHLAAIDLLDELTGESE